MHGTACATIFVGEFGGIHRQLEGIDTYIRETAESHHGKLSLHTQYNTLSAFPWVRV